MKYPIGIQNFGEVRRGEYVYVDKTAWMWKMIDEGKYYFLSRPRRFGKSLTVSTLKAVFEGKKELFQGLALYDKPYDWKAYPVIHLSFGDYSVVSNAAEELPDYLMSKMRTLAKEHSISLEAKSPGLCFAELIDRLSEKEKVVILIDEYDKPILGNITDSRVREIRDMLKGFYSVLKDRNDKERLLFITGVSKFSHVSLFSELNNLTDITLDADYAGMLGFTEAEVREYFADRIPEAAKVNEVSEEELMQPVLTWHDG